MYTLQPGNDFGMDERATRNSRSAQVFFLLFFILALKPALWKYRFASTLRRGHTTCYVRPIKGFSPICALKIN